MGRRKGEKRCEGISGRRRQHRRLSTPAGDRSRVFRLHEGCFFTLLPAGLSLSLEISGLEAETARGRGGEDADTARRILTSWRVIWTPARE